MLGSCARAPRTRLLRAFFMVVLAVAAATSGVGATPTAGAVEPTVPTDAQLSGTSSAFSEATSVEVPELRDEFSRTYRNNDGTNTTRISPYPMHYQRDGQWIRIDPTLVEDVVAGTYRTASNRWTAYFGPTTTGVRISDTAGDVVLVPVGAAPVAPTVGDDRQSVTYADAWPGVDLVYRVTATEVKEEIVLKRRPAQTTFSFTTDGVAYEADPTAFTVGALRPRGPLGDSWQVPPAVVLDKQRVPVDGSPATITATGAGTLAALHVDVDPAYLDALDASDYPIVVDPTHRTGAGGSHSFRGNGEACWNCPIRVGNPDGNWWTWRGMAYFPYENLYGKYITYAQLDIWNLFAGTSSGQVMDVYHATAFDWISLGQQLIDNAWGSYGYNMTSESLRSFYDSLVYNKSGGAYLKYLGEEGNPGWYTYKEFHAFELQLDWVERAPVRTSGAWHSGNLYEDQTITVWQNWSHPTDSARLFVCQAPGVNTGGCTGGTWGSGGWTSPGNTAGAAFVPGHNLGTREFWAYVCTGGACSDASYGTFDVWNRPPSLTGTVTENRDPVDEGSTITFSVPFSDYATGTARAVVCKTNSPNGGSCDAGQGWTVGGFAGSAAQATYSVPAGTAAGAYTYFAFACDQNNACSGAQQSTFTVNKIPVIGTATDSPDPITAGGAITFSAPYTDTAADNVRAIVCKTNSVSAGSCPGGAWATGTAGTSSPRTASYSTVQADVGAAKNYWAFACDANNACSASSAGAFTVLNATPAINSVIVSPDPVAAGDTVTFTVSYSDGGGDADRAVICKTNAISASGTCPGGAWATGSITAGGSAAASYSTVQADVGAARAYWAFACDAANACSSSASGTFTVTNSAPSLTSVSDSPDPVSSGSTITFAASWTDSPGDNVRLVVCKTNAQSGGACSGGTWAAGSLTSSTPATAAYTTTQADVGSYRDYWAFACDAANVCSASTKGTFVVGNVAPTLVSVSDGPDPVNVGGSVTFALSWSDTGGDQAYAVVCKTNALAPNTSCPGGTWATGWLSADNPATATYTAAVQDVGTKTYYAFICDSASTCSASQTGTFRVNGVPSATAASDSPDPATAGTPITFSVLYADDPGDTVRAVVCKTNAISSTGTCPGGQWGTGPGGLTSPATTSYTPSQADVGITHSYWAFACDDDNACSAAQTGSFGVNNATPSLTSVGDAPDPAVAGNAVTFTITYTDGGGDADRAVICKTNAISATGTCPGGAWATGQITAGGTAAASYTTVQADVGAPRSYWAFACDASAACSSSVSGSFSVLNATPAITAAADAPDPAVSGATVTFTVGFTDGGGDADRAVICKSNAVSSGTCAGGAWAIGSYSSTGTATASYASVQADVGVARSYWAFACDAANLCSPAIAGSFTVGNATPAIVSVSDTPDPVVAGQAVTFTVSYSDGGGDADRAVICKTNAISASGTCPGGAWATGAITAGGSAAASYSTVQADVGAARNYWAFACDSANACSPSIAGAFTVANAVPSISGVSDSPDPVTSGGTVTFTITYTDGGGDADRAVVCKTNAISGSGTCLGGAWAIGSITAGGTATASYTTVQADVGGPRNYYAFACDAANACSPTSVGGSFSVANATPTLVTASDAPDPVVAGGTVTFTLTYTDGGGDADRAVICKTNEVSSGSCTGGTWTTGAMSPGGIATATYPTVQADVGAARTYWAFACDASNACSPSTAGSFTVMNAVPVMTAVTDAPDPALAGDTVTFTVAYTDGGGDADRAVICKTNAISSGTCAGGAWAVGSITAGSTATASYVTVQADVGAARAYYAFACDAANACSPATAGAFTVANATPVIVSADRSSAQLPSGSVITFTVTYTDAGGDADRAVICKTNAIASGTCTEGTWAIGPITAGGTAAASYTTVQGDVGTRTFHAFACDAANACSSAIGGTFTVTNVTPTLSTVADGPDPVASGSTVTFTLGWSDTGGDTNRAVICRTNAISAGSCSGGAWATGPLSDGGSSTASYSTVQADVGGSRSYWAFVCDSAGACSSSIPGTFSVVNAAPSIVSVVDSPDPAFAGGTVTFTVNYTDGGGDADRAVICRTNAISNSTCPGGSWTTGPLSPSGAATATLGTSQFVVGTNAYWAFACDAAGLCTAGIAGSFTVMNATPSVAFVEDGPDPVAAGGTVSFTVGYTDGGDDADRAVICKTNATSSGTCTGGTWTSGEIMGGGVATAAYTTVQSDVGTQAYYAFACDAANACSSGVAGSFVVTNVRPTAGDVTAAPAPATVGSPITFSLEWTDAGGDTNRVLVCKSDELGPTATCAGGTWVRGSLGATSPATATYVARTDDLGPQLFWAFACDSHNLCSDPVLGSFVVVPAVPSSASG